MRKLENPLTVKTLRVDEREWMAAQKIAEARGTSLGAILRREIKRYGQKDVNK
jgi:hypothetical protein